MEKFMDRFWEYMTLFFLLVVITYLTVQVSELKKENGRLRKQVIHNTRNIQFQEAQFDNCIDILMTK